MDGQLMRRGKIEQLLQLAAPQAHAENNAHKSAAFA